MICKSLAGKSSCNANSWTIASLGNSAVAILSAAAAASAVISGDIPPARVAPAVHCQGTEISGGVMSFTSTSTQSICTSAGCRHTRVISQAQPASSVACKALINPIVKSVVMAFLAA
jgi:hypothetical protein